MPLKFARNLVSLYKRCPYCGQVPAQRGKLVVQLLLREPHPDQVVFEPRHLFYHNTYCCSDHWRPYQENQALRYAGIPYDDPAETARHGK